MRRALLIVLSISLMLLSSIQVFTRESNAWVNYQLIRCDLHRHTRDSRTPPTNAKNIGDLDHFFAASVKKAIQILQKFGFHVGISDHDSKTTSSEWDAKKRVIDQFCDEGFATLRGFEWTGPNHINIFNSSDFVTVFDVGAEGITECKDYDSLFDWLATQPDDVIAQFNHPTMNNKYFDFAKYANHPAKEHFKLIEVGSGPDGFYSHISDNLPQVILAYQHGYHLGLSIGSDNFDSSKLAGIIRHTALLVTDNSREAMVEAIKSCRTFASEDVDVQVKFQLHITEDSGQESIAIMGSRAEINESSKFRLEYDLNDPTDHQMGKVNVVVVRSESYDILPVANNQDIPRTISNSDFVYSELQDIICFFLYIVQADGDSIVTSPIWIKYRPKPVVDHSERFIYCGVDSNLPVFRHFVKDPNGFAPKESKLYFLGPRDKQICIWLVIYNQPVDQPVSLKLHLICPESNVDVTHEEVCIGKNNNFCLAFGICDIKDFAYRIHETNYLTIEFIVDDQVIETQQVLIEVDNR